MRELAAQRRFEGDLLHFALHLLRPLVGFALEIIDLALYGRDLLFLFSDAQLRTLFGVEDRLGTDVGQAGRTRCSTVSSSSRLASSGPRRLRSKSVCACWASASSD